MRKMKGVFNVRIFRVVSIGFLYIMRLKVSVQTEFVKNTWCMWQRKSFYSKSRVTKEHTSKSNMTNKSYSWLLFF